MNVSTFSVKNLALGKPGMLSSVQNQLASNFTKLVDGDRNGNWNSGSCAVTYASPASMDPWVYVDLQLSYLVEAVLLSNRNDCCRKYFSICIAKPFSTSLAEAVVDSIICVIRRLKKQRGQ